MQKRRVYTIHQTEMIITKTIAKKIDDRTKNEIKQYRELNKRGFLIRKQSLRERRQSKQKRNKIYTSQLKKHWEDLKV